MTYTVFAGDILVCEIDRYIDALLTVFAGDIFVCEIDRYIDALLTALLKYF